VGRATLSGVDLSTEVCRAIVAHLHDLIALSAGATRDGAAMARARGARAARPWAANLVDLRDVEGLSTAEVADALGIPVSTAKTRAHRTRLLLRKRISTFMEIERPSETEVPTRSSEG
jgi:hypothetical protein